MPNIFDGLGLQGSVLDGIAEWPASTTRKEWFAITRKLIQQTIADMDLDPAALAEVEEAFIGAGGSFFDKRSHCPRRGGLAGPMSALQRTTSVVILLRQSRTHLLSPIDRHDWSTGWNQRDTSSAKHTSLKPNSS